ncbi:N-alpha-acetyltransferase 38, NatC auxiliary subunit-like isoform X1 [Apostichopus japonicus]|uniref:N-alpha-acetyltransferase 38, NatC auxiliary subunit-like isoform X1 n=1 Tax=Stichopus japonicus TaxID=307972 RepID=UPI003AB3E651
MEQQEQNSGSDPVSDVISSENSETASATESTTISTQNSSISEESQSRKTLEGWLNRFMRIKMTDGRILVGAFVCTDRDRNIILGSCDEYVNAQDLDDKEEPRVLGLAMVPGQHILSIEIDDPER